MTALDRVVEVVPGRRAVALRNVTQTLDVLATHFPRFPVLPGVLVLDDVVAVARLAAGAPPPPATGWVLSTAGRLRYRHFVEPGDQMEITVDVLASDARTATCRGTVRVQGRAVTTVGTLVMRRSEQEDS